MKITAEQFSRIVDLIHNSTDVKRNSEGGYDLSLREEYEVRAKIDDILK